VLANYQDVLLAHVTVDLKVTEVLLPGATAAPSGGTTQAPYQVTFSSNCRNSGKASASAKIAVSLGLLRQVASGSNVFGDRGRLRSNHGAETSRDYRAIGTVEKDAWSHVVSKACHGWQQS
jgi:hypothetical protein